jgi:hypothetical protein
LAITFQDIIDAARDLIEEPAESEIRNASNCVRWGAQGDQWLLKVLPREFLADYARSKSWTLSITTNVYVFTTSDSFSGILDGLQVMYLTSTTSKAGWREGTRFGAERRAALKSRIQVGVSLDKPGYIAEGLSLELYPTAPAAVAGGLLADYRKAVSLTAWSTTLTATWSFDDLAFGAATKHMIYLAKGKLGLAMSEPYYHKATYEVMALWEMVGRPPPNAVRLLLTGPSPPKG